MKCAIMAPMTIRYKNRRDQIYYLHQGKTKTGRVNYFFSMKSDGDPVDAIPEGFEIYENPNAQVFLRRKRPKIIMDEEAALVDRGVKQFSDLEYYLIDTKNDTITVLTANQDWNPLSEAFGFVSYARAKEIFRRFLSYTPMLQFVLKDKEKREFIVRRYCFLGSVEDWITIGGPGELQDLVKKFVRHLGKDSFYELF